MSENACAESFKDLQVYERLWNFSETAQGNDEKLFALVPLIRLLLTVHCLLFTASL
jgi:hypothetical protein